jgi:mRNA interferase RelE/StbE
VSYTARFRPRPAKQLEALPKGVRRTIAQVIDALAENPRPSGAVQLKGTDFMRARVREYRVVYEVRDDVLLILVVRIGHRRDIYRGL